MCAKKLFFVLMAAAGNLCHAAAHAQVPTLIAQAPPGQTQGSDWKWERDLFSDLKVDFGTVARGSETRHRIEIKNPFKEMIYINDVKPLCGCTTINALEGLKGKALKTRETAHIEIKMDTIKFMRQKDTGMDVTVSLDNVHLRTVRIPISLYIRPDVVLDPGSVNFGAVELGKDAEKRVKVAYAGRNDWKIREVRSSSDLVDVKAEEKSRGNGQVTYELVAKLKSSAPVGDVRGQITLVTDDANNPDVPVLMEATVEPDFVVSPADVALGSLQVGSSKTVNVIIRGRSPFQIERIECEKAHEVFKTVIPEKVQKVHVLPLTINTPNQSGEIAEEFTVYIKDHAEPIKFKAHGVILGEVVKK